MSTIQTKRKHLIEFLKKELGGIDNVKSFSSQLKSLNLCDLTVDEEFEKATADGGAILQTFVTWYTLGLLPKLVEIQNLMKKENK